MTTWTGNGAAVGRRHRPAGRPAHGAFGHGGVSVAFSPDGKTVLTGSRDKTARLWDAATGQPVGRPWSIRQMVYAVAFSPDGKTILTGSLDKTARLWDAATGRASRPPMVHRACDVRGLQPRRQDGPHRQLGQDGAAVGRRHRPAPRPAHGAFGLCESVAFSPDGKTILTGSSDRRDAAVGRRHRPADRPAHAARSWHKSWG